MRLVTINIWQEQGPWPERLQLLERRLRAFDPDVVCLQEVRQVPDKVANQAETLARGLGYHVTFEVAQPWGGGDEGLAILSRAPILQREARELPFEQGRTRRICLAARVQSGAGSCWVLTTHLAYRRAAGELRERQVLAVEQLLRELRQGPEAAVLAGDFNATPDSDEIRFLCGLTTLEGRRTYYQDAFASCNPGLAGHTWCSANPYTVPLRWLGTDRRLDYIFVTPMSRAGAGIIERCQIICNEPDARGIWCSDHYGLLAEIKVFPD